MVVILIVFSALLFVVILIREDLCALRDECAAQRRGHGRAGADLPYG